MILAALTTEDYLEEARMICRELHGAMWFAAGYRTDPATRAPVPFYRVFRRGMGCVAERGSARSLVAYLRTQRPAA